MKQLEPYTPLSNAAEREMKELKKGAGCKLLKSRAPKQLWDNCIELEAYIRSNRSTQGSNVWRDIRHQSILQTVDNVL